MYNKAQPDEDGNDHDYSPNELAELSRNNPRLYKEIVESNLGDNDTVEQWEQRNLERMQKFLKQK